MKLSFGTWACRSDSFAAIALAGGLAYPDDHGDHELPTTPVAEQEYVYRRQPDQADLIYPRQPEQSATIHPRKA
jgi:hypothetical protein